MSDKNSHDDPLQYAALIAHQLKSPVGAAGSLLKMMLGEYAGHLNPRQKDILLRADKRIDEAIDTVRRMLTIVRPDSSEVGTYTEAASLLHRMHQHFNEESRLKSISFTLHIKQEPVYIGINDAHLTEALHALINNSMKYTPVHGKVQLSLSVSEDGKKVIIVVSDSGIGVAEDQRDKIFEPFYRTHAAQASSVPGVGLGLAFVKALVDSAEGSIRVEKSEFGGAKFVMELPHFNREEFPSVGPSDELNRLKVVIIGGIAAGPKVAAKVIRLDPNAMVTIIEKSDLLSYSGCGLPYYISGVITNQKQLLSTPLGAVRDSVFFQNIKNINVLNRTEAMEIDRAGKRVLVKNLQTGHETWVLYDKLVLATGAYPLTPEIPGSNLKNIFTLHGVRDAEGVRMFISKSKAHDVVIIGGGLIGLEMTEALAVRGCRVTIIEEKNQIMRSIDQEMVRLLEQYMETKGLRIMTNTRALSYTGNESVDGVETDKGRIPTDLVIIGIGVRPQVELAMKAGLELGITGGIKVDGRMLTSDPDIYAAGDCVESVNLQTGQPCFVPLGSTANKHGRVVAINICNGNETFPGILGTLGCKIFDYCIARTGLNENEAHRAGYDTCTVLLASTDREHFMPDAQMLMLKMVVDKKSRRLLGLQAVGPGDGAKRIDIAATAISAGMTIDQIAHLDLCYAPPFSLAIDNIITAANIARNKLSGLFKSVTPMEVHSWLEAKKEMVLLDVSTPLEYELCRIPGSVLIPLATIRVRHMEIPRDKDIVVFCKLSIRGYEAALILQAAGFTRVYMMDGGIEMWPYEKVYGMK